MNIRPSRINDQIRVHVYADEKDTRGSISQDQARNYAEYAKQQADRAGEYAELIIENVKAFADKNYVHEQAIASSEWYIQHDLNKYPTATVVDSAGNEIICDIEYRNENVCVITMTSPFKGKAILN